MQIKILYYPALLLTFSLLVIACNNNEPATEEASIVNDQALSQQAPAQNRAQQQEVTDLKSLRQQMNREYKRGQEEIDERKKMPPSGAQGECKYCDTQFLARFYANRRLDTSQLPYLLCTDTEACDKNPEFLEFYNEVIYRVATEQPLEFLKAVRENNGNLDRLQMYINNPIRDDMDPQNISNTLSAVNKEIGGDYSKELSVLLEGD